MYDDEKTIFLVFCESNSYFLSRFLMPGFRHVFAFQKSMDRWMLIDGSLNNLNILELRKAEGLDLIASHKLLSPDHTILEVKILSSSQMPVWRIGPISCVSTIQYLLGIYWPLTLTPRSLYLRLIKHTPPHIRIMNHGRI